MKKPLVSVIMPIYNGSFYMSKAIDSILSQTYQNFELLIIDDASTDNTWEILKKYKKDYPKRVKIFQLLKNSGAFKAANYALSFAKGDYIAPMDSDDISHPERLSKQVAYLIEHPDTILVGTFAKIIDSRGRVTGFKRYALDHKHIYRQFAEINPIVHPSCMIRRNLLPKGNFSYFTNYGVNSDYYTFFYLLQYGRFANLPEYLLSYRVHGQNSSLQNLKKNFYTISRIQGAAVRDFNYIYPLSVLPKVILQHIIVALTPASLLLPLYLKLRGVKVPSRRRFNYDRLVKRADIVRASTIFNRVVKTFQYSR